MENNRRDFIKKGFGIMAAAGLPTSFVFAEKRPEDITPLGFPEDLPAGKHKELTVLSEKPWNIETPVHLLDDEVTPADKIFIRNNGLAPEHIDVNNWTLTIEGESVKTARTFSLKDLKTKYKVHTYQLQLECGGNSRSGFSPQTSGNPWGDGAISCAEWTGVRLKDLLQEVGIKDDAVYIGYYGKDLHLSGDPKKSSISRGVPMKKALEDETLIAWAMNGQDIPLMNGYPLRLVVGGWPGSTSGKWLDRIVVRNKVHDGEKMQGDDYKVPVFPIEPGAKVKPEDMKIIESMPVKSLITYPKTGAMINFGKKLSLRGHAWAGDHEVKEMFVSIDFGTTWQKCELAKPKNRLAWQHWKAEIDFPQKGYYEVWAKATDDQGRSQPMVMPAWNPKGYLNNSCHRIAVKIV
jgi:DMSO/TMAO reductase YedYZ molybdopterin-dependent catalytic subunit